MRTKFKFLLCLLILIFPWPIRRILLIRLFGYRIDPTAFIGYSLILPKVLSMGPGARIGSLCVAIHLEKVILGKNARIGRLNWITGFPLGGSKHFTEDKHRMPALIVGDESAITKQHHLDCTSTISIGSFSTIAGYNSQFLTHSINISSCRQESYPIAIGDYCFVGSRCTILGGAVLPSYSVLGACSLLTQAFSEPFSLYGGTPAKALKTLEKESKYFSRTCGFVG